ncbi:carbohydrate ABC transporter permease [Falsibacillus pallidus]|uniref:Carbohydrate ABC transporter membrane protein 1 (CUT1 family) n=1 Tax=Falsibacillus pallidus TaxID=493781 RepID=A0A370FXW3_9BACI|nr:sugar ABC transporter permease [Falsibacillus pallidus]RDI36471.1 carbohydrate ABC transporter membrane protein 1 (CUT1 family) [Falsibacillus pallidus]
MSNLKASTEAPIISTKPKTKAPLKQRMRKHLVHLFLLPAVVLYGVFQLYPLITAVINSFYSWDGFSRDSFVGFQNFTTLLTESPFKETFIRAFTHNWIFFIVTFFTELTIAFALALVINSRLKGKGFFKTIFFVPKLLSVIVIGFLFSLILNPTSGAINVLLKTVGLDFLAQPWLGNTSTALVTIVLIHSWAGIGFSMLIFLASLQSVDKEIFEAARIDGAHGVSMLFKITLPMVMNSVMTMTILTFIGSFETFELIFAMQGSAGGPYYSTDVLGTYFYRLAFGSAEGGQALGLGSAIAVILFLIIACATSILLYYFKRKDFER